MIIFVSSTYIFEQGIRYRLKRHFIDIPALHKGCKAERNFFQKIPL